MTASGNDTELIANMQQPQDWANVTVVSVSGANVTFQQVLYNATTTQPETIIYDVENGQGNGSVSWYSVLFFAADLSAGDLIYIRSEVVVVNETVAADYLGQQLETNHLTGSVNYTNIDYYGYMVNATYTGHLFLERKTGIMLDYHVVQDISRPDGAGGVLTTNWVLRELILSAIPPPPVIPELPSSAVLASFVVVTLLAVIAYKRRTRA